MLLQRKFADRSSRSELPIFIPRASPCGGQQAVPLADMQLAVRRPMQRDKPCFSGEALGVRRSCL